MDNVSNIPKKGNAEGPLPPDIQKRLDMPVNADNSQLASPMPAQRPAPPLGEGVPQPSRRPLRMVADPDALVAVPSPKPSSNPARLRPRLYTWEQFRGLPQAKWLIDGVLPEGGFSVLYGPPGSGKTFVALNWMLQLAKSGKQVAYVAAEGHGGLNKRISAWLEHHKLRDEALETLILHPSALDMLSDKAALEFSALFKTTPKPDFIVIDTLARCFGNGDENLAQDMGAFVGQCDKLRELWPGCTVLVLHHTGKDTKKGMRGSSALNGAADCVMEIVPKGSVFSLICDKMKDAEEFKPKGMLLKMVGNSCVVAEQAAGPNAAGGARQPSKMPASASKALEVLMGLTAERGGEVDVATWRDLCSGKLSRSETPDAQRKVFDRAVEKLEALGRISLADGKVRLVN